MKGASMAVSKRTRFEVLRRDSHTCRYCGQSAISGAEERSQCAVTLGLSLDALTVVELARDEG